MRSITHFFSFQLKQDRILYHNSWLCPLCSLCNDSVITVPYRNITQVYESSRGFCNGSGLFEGMHKDYCCFNHYAVGVNLSQGVSIPGCSCYGNKRVVKLPVEPDSGLLQLLQYASAGGNLNQLNRMDHEHERSKQQRARDLAEYVSWGTEEVMQLIVQEITSLQSQSGVLEQVRAIITRSAINGRAMCEMTDYRSLFDCSILFLVRCRSCCGHSSSSIATATFQYRH